VRPWEGETPVELPVLRRPSRWNCRCSNARRCAGAPPTGAPRAEG